MTEQFSTDRAIVLASIEAAPSGAETVHFSGVTDLADGPTLDVLFKPTAEASPAWIGVFNPGYPAQHAASGVYAFSVDDSRVLVISGGQGFVVNADNKRDWLALHRPFPITFAASVVSHDFVVVADMTSVTAVGADRVAWAALDLGDGDVVIDEVTDGFVEGRGWHAPSQEFIRFRLRLHDGAQI